MTKKFKKTFVSSELTTYSSSISGHSHYTTEPTVSGRQRKVFNSLQSYLSGSCWIQLIHLINRIQYKIGKNIVNSKMTQSQKNAMPNVDTQKCWLGFKWALYQCLFVSRITHFNAECHHNHCYWFSPVSFAKAKKSLEINSLAFFIALSSNVTSRFLPVWPTFF